MKRYFLIVFAAFLAIQSLDAQPPRVPESIVFAGQTITFDRPDLYERMDRELLVARARDIIDFSAAYDVEDAATGRRCGTWRRT